MVHLKDSLSKSPVRSPLRKKKKPVETVENIEELSDVDPAPISSKYMVKCKIKFENLDNTLHELREKISL